MTADGFPWRAEDTRSEHTGPFDTECEDLTFDETTRVRSEVPELVDFDTGLEAVYAFYV